MYTLLESVVICWHSLATLSAEEDVQLAVKHLKNHAYRHKKSPFDIICHRGKTVGGTGLEPVTSCL
jgi:hypothetical protein